MKDTVKTMIKDLSAELKVLKTQFRDPKHQPPQLSLYRKIWTYSFRVTVLCAAMASTHNRVHRHDHDLEAQQEFVDKHLNTILKAAA
jgi:hypothetical protein